MSRKKKNSGDCCANRCMNCGGRLRLVNVTWIDRTRAPEASQYDLSVSRRKAMLANTPPTTTQEMMCTCCGQRVSVVNVKKKKRKRKGFVALIDTLLFIAAIAAGIYFAYEYKQDLIEFWQPLENVFNTIDDAGEYIKNLFKK